MKLAEFQLYLKKNNIGVAVFTHPDPCITYFTQMVPSHAVLCITPKKATFLITKLDKMKKVSGIDIQYFSKDWKKKLSKKTEKLGVNKQSLTVSSLENMKKMFPKAKVVDVSSTLTKLRETKTKKEIQCISKACKITSNAFDALIQELPKKKLHTEQDVAFFLERHFQKEGGEVAFPTIAAVGKNAAIPHHVTSNALLQRGFLLIDFGAKYKNYCADMTRMIFLGKPSEEEKGWYNLLYTSQEDARLAVADGVKYSELDKTARKSLGKYEKKFIHSLGHGIGLEVHENPVFSNGKVKHNVPFTIEPGIYFPGKFGLRIEDTVIFDGKLKVLTVASKKLPEIAGW